MRRCAGNTKLRRDTVCCRQTPNGAAFLRLMTDPVQVSAKGDFGPMDERHGRWQICQTLPQPPMISLQKGFDFAQCDMTGFDHPGLPQARVDTQG
jgi:hypothetical protein